MPTPRVGKLAYDGVTLLNAGEHQTELLFKGDDLSGYATGKLALRRLQLFEDNGELIEVEELLDITRASSGLYVCGCGKSKTGAVPSASNASRN